MKILVTGGAGFIGSNFIHFWHANSPQDTIINLDKLTYAGNRQNLEDLERVKSYQFIKGDIADAKLVEKSMKGVDIVVNFAAESHVDRSILDPAPFIITNVVGTQVLLDAALKNKVSRFHHISTDEVYGSLDLSSNEKFNEATPYRPNSPYAASKAASDHLVRAYHKTYNLPVTITNCSNNFGPYQFPEKLIPLAITNLLDGEKVPIYGDGLYVRDWLYVEDHCRAIGLVLKNGEIGQTYCIGFDNDIPNIQVVKKIIRILEKNEDEIIFVKDRPGHDRKYAIDSQKITHELDFHPKYKFDEALKMTVKWYVDNKKWWKNLKNQKFKQYYKTQYKNR